MHSLYRFALASDIRSSPPAYTMDPHTSKSSSVGYQRCAVQATHHYGAITVSVQLGCPHLCIDAMLLSAVFRLNQTFLPIRLGWPIKDPVVPTAMLAIDYLNIHALSESGTTNSCHLAAGGMCSLLRLSVFVRRSNGNYVQKELPLTINRPLGTSTVQLPCPKLSTHRTALADSSGRTVAAAGNWTGHLGVTATANLGAWGQRYSLGARHQRHSLVARLHLHSWVVDTLQLVPLEQLLLRVQ